MANAVPPVSYKALAMGPQRGGRGYTEALDNLGTSMDPDHFGFFLLVETQEAIPLDLRRALSADTRAFYALPQAVRDQFYFPETGGQRGITPYGEERGVGALIGDPKRHYMFGAEGIEPFPNINCREVPTLKRHALAVLGHGQEMAFAVYRGLATVAGVAPDTFESYRRPLTTPNSSLRGARYSITDDELDILLKEAEASERREDREMAARIRADPSLLYRAFPHTDIDDFTFVLREEKQDVAAAAGYAEGEGGLEMVTAEGTIPVKSDNWHDLACNIGDLFNLRTGWASTTHQVGFSSRERYSWPIFFHPPRGSGLALLREAARAAYEDTFRTLYGNEVYQSLPAEQRPTLGRNEVQILYDHFLLKRLVELRLKPKSELEAIVGTRPPLQEPIRLAS